MSRPFQRVHRRCGAALVRNRTDNLLSPGLTDGIRQPAASGKYRFRMDENLDKQKPAAEQQLSFTRLSPEELASILEAHREWAQSFGATGTQAQLQKADLYNAQLQGANLYK